MSQQKKLSCILLLASLLLQTGCYFFNKRKFASGDDETPAVFTRPLGPKAGGIDQEALEDVYQITTTHAPASVRPDPDTFVRQTILQFRSQGTTVAREVGRVEQYRLLLGGASEDFVTNPQKSYDATSLLAEIKVSQEVCEGLVNPNANDHPGWSTILQEEANNSQNNIRFLIQRLMGIPSSHITDEMTTSLSDILEGARVNGRIEYSSYVPVCTAILLDAQSLLL